jgi:hypothetical protein
MLLLPLFSRASIKLSRVPRLPVPFRKSIHKLSKQSHLSSFSAMHIEIQNTAEVWFTISLQI